VSNATGNDLSVNNDGTIYGTGSFLGPFVSAGGNTAFGTGDQDGYIVKVDPAGTTDWIQQVGGIGPDDGLRVSSRDDERTYLSGHFTQYIRVAGDEIFNPAGSTIGFWSRIDFCPDMEAEMISPDTTFVCRGNSALFEVTDDPAYTYQWFRDGSPVSGSDVPELTVDEGGTYSVFIDGAICDKFTPAATLIVRALPDSTVVSAEPLEQCAGESFLLNGPSVRNYTYQWFRDGVALATETVKDIIISTSGDYQLRVTDTLTCSNYSIVFPARFHAYPLNTLMPPGRHVICAGDSVVIEADSSQPGLTYQWQERGFDISGETQSFYKARTNGIFSVVIKNSIGCQTVSVRDTIVVQSNPVVNLNDESVAHEICAGETVDLATTDINGQTYQWIKDGVLVPGEVSSMFVLNSAGVYRVRVRNSTCEVTSNPFSLSINPLPAATIANHANASICLHTNYELRAVTLPTYSYQWHLNGSPIAAATNDRFNVMETGNYSVKVTNEFNCSQQSPATTVTVNLLPPASVLSLGPTTFCQGGTVTLRANTGPGFQYQWRRDGNLITGAVSREMVVTATGNYSVNITNSNLCVQASTATSVNVVQFPDAMLVQSSGVNSICERDSVLLNAGTGPGYEFSWLFNKQKIQIANGNSMYAKLPGSYQVVASIGSCRDTSTVVSLAVRSNPVPVITRNVDFLSIGLQGQIQWYKNTIPISGARQQVIQASENGNYSVSIVNEFGCTARSQPMPMCLPVPEIQKNEDVLTVNITGGSYTWNYGGLPIKGAFSRVLVAQQSGDYTAVVTDRNGCQMETAAVRVCVPFPVITPDPVTGVLYATPNPAFAYQWFFEGEPITDATTQAHIPDFPGMYYVVVTDLKNCTSSSETYEVELVTGTGEVEFENASVRIYPNPVTKMLIIERAIPESNVTVSLFSSDGRMALQEKISNGMHVLNLEQLSAGVYWLNLGTGDRSVKRMIVKK
jgi:predicted RNase H-like HicB family nuclease